MVYCFVVKRIGLAVFEVNSSRRTSIRFAWTGLILGVSLGGS